MDSRGADRSEGLGGHLEAAAFQALCAVLLQQLTQDRLLLALFAPRRKTRKTSEIKIAPKKEVEII